MSDKVILLVTAGAILFSVTTAFAEPGLVAHWKFDEANGTTAYDSAGGNDGTLFGNPTWMSGQIDGALDFDGTGDFINAGHDSILNVNAFTISAWVYRRESGKSMQTIVDKMRGLPQNGGYTLYTDANDKVTVVLSGGDYSAPTFKTNNAFPSDTWVHVAATFEGGYGVSSGEIKVYYDGAEQTGTEYNYGGPVYSNARNVLIGAYSQTLGTPGKWNGIIDDVRIYDRDLSAGEIVQLYLEGLAYIATAPNPPEAATGVEPNVVLSCRPGKDANSHNVYFGTDYNDVNEADTNSAEYKGNFDVNYWDPCGLDLLTTYYWRVDEVNDGNIWKGEVWSFETAGPTIGLSATQFHFPCFYEGANPNGQILGISNIGAGTVNWQISYDCNWLSAEPNSGSSTGEVDEVNLSVDISGLAEGSYDCSLTISDPNAVNNPQVTSVHLYILPYVEEVLYVPSEYPTIQAAIDSALDGDVVIVSPGIYTGSGNRDLDYGGKAITVKSIDPNNPNIVAATVIDCNGSETEWHGGFNFYNGEDSNSVVEGLTITNGYLYGGAGIYCYGASPTISKCRFIDGTVEEWSVGGGIYCSGSSPVISDCNFTGNSAGDGGAVAIRGSCAPVIKNCMIRSNTGLKSGGGIYSGVGSTPIIENCIIIDNFAENYGGGISIYESNPTVRKCIISDNSTNIGGGIYCNDSNLLITNCDFTGNFAGGGGGMNIIEDSNVTVVDCNFTGNTAQLYDGGGIYCGDSNATLESCTIAENNAIYWGGGICALVCNLTITECTIRDNRLATESLESRGGGIFCGTANVTIKKCMIKSNRAESESGLGGGVCGSYGITLTIEDSNIAENIAGSYGGGICADGNCNTIITDCTIRDNIAMGTEDWTGGGGIYGGDAEVTVKRCVIKGNRAEGESGLGGGVRGSSYEDEGSLMIENCIISENVANGDGGVARCNGPISNCIITNNTASGGMGGGLGYCQNISNCTITNNTASWAGGLSYCQGITNCIIWGNYAVQYPQLDDSCSEPNYSCVQDWSGGGTGNISADPCFVNPDANDFHLKQTSPCINSGDPDYVAEPNETDIDGDGRVLYGRVDMGADELIGDCMAQANPDYDTWVSLGEPNCWCYERQCSGDADGYKQVLFWVYSIDLSILKSAYGKPNIDSEPLVCADFDHKEQVLFRVYSNDLAILRSYYGKTNVPSCSNPPDPNFNYWTLP